MAKKLVIVESPAKAQTIKKILGKNYEVTASVGHIRDLPKSKLGIDIENNFEPSYKTIKGKGEITKKLKQLAKKADKVYLASDMDREGEAIAWHLSQILSLNDEAIRIEFNEITESAIKEAIKNPRKLDFNKINAQQARRILDRLVGYKISPLLWKIINSNTSAGRVQSVALKLICELEEVIKNFKVEKFWEVRGIFNQNFNLNLYKIKDEKIDKIKDKKIIDLLEKEILKKEFNVIKTKVSNKRKKPPLPLKTSTLQQLASSYLGFSASKTMKTAQNLYEGLEINGTHIGLITYMRTDSTRISDEALKSAKEYIEKNYDKKYIGKFQNLKSKGKIQDAHEAIRPTDININPSIIENILSKDQYKLYKLIWERFLISQFADVEYEQFEIINEYKDYQFRGIINKVTFDGYYKIFKEEDEILTSDFPEIKEGDILLLNKLDIKEGETKPPARLTESSLVKKLETEGIGRPSTYASIIETLKKREYVELQNKSFFPTKLGTEVKSYLEKYFPNIMNTKFTAKMEENLDNIEEGTKEWKSVLSEFYQDLEKFLKNFEKEVEEISNKRIEADILCPKCSKKMLLKSGRFGKYLRCEDENCSGKYSLKGINIPKEDIEKGFINVKEDILKVLNFKNGLKTDMFTDKGALFLLKNGRFGAYLESENFKEDGLRLTLFPEIKKALKENIINFNNDVLEIKDLFINLKKVDEDLIKKVGKCEKCGSDFIVKRGRWGKFLACSSYPNCKNIRKLPK